MVEFVLRRDAIVILHESEFSGQIGYYNNRHVVPGDRLWIGTKPNGWEFEQFHFPDAPVPWGVRTFLGFGWHWEDTIAGEGLFSSVRSVTWTLQIPFWAMTCFFSFAPALWLRQPAFRKTSAANPCGVCGYDLRATPDRCPECGTAQKR
jgi:hypothetical protein